jgi:hypothetical protein
MIPHFLEQLIHEGKAAHKTFSGAVAENLVLTVPDNTYAVIYEYWYKPQIQKLGGVSGGAASIDFADTIQFVNFFNSEGFNSYWHEFMPDYISKSVITIPTVNPTLAANYQIPAGEHTEYRSCYIKTSRDISIYFTRLNPDDLALTTGAVPAIDPLNNWFGYADPLLLINQLVSGYHNNAALLANYEPLQEFITKQVIPAARPDFVNQMFTLPFYGGAIANAAAYAGAGTSALGKSRAQHFQCNYVLVNKPNPKNLI